MPELNGIYAQQPDAALDIAERVIRENLTLETIRALVRGYVRPEHRERSGREEVHNHRGAATSVKSTTKKVQQAPAPDTREGQANLIHPLEDAPLPDHPSHVARPSTAPTEPQLHSAAPATPDTEIAEPTDDTDLLLLREAAAALESVASRASGLPVSPSTDQALALAERALVQIRSNVTDAALAQVRIAKPSRYQLIDTLSTSS
jgi:hypothetical protein